MTTPTKRSSPEVAESPRSKRIRSLPSPRSEISNEWIPNDGVDATSLQSTIATQQYQIRTGIQRSIATVLRHDGFQSASPEAMESFTNLVEGYLDSLIEDIKTTALAARREGPTPVDFAHALRRFNIPVSSLKPHRRYRLPENEYHPAEYVDESASELEAVPELPLLSEELSGKADKDRKSYIPASFPDFPSRHTYSFTPQEDINIRDPKRTREEAARTAQQGEDALRRLVRASKMRKQKEVKSLVERDEQGKERFRLWELTMRRFMGTDAREEKVDQIEAADHSMIVNSDTQFSRKEVPRQHKRTPV